MSNNKEEKAEKEISQTKNHINPFLHPYGTPHETVPFDKIILSDYEEAFLEGIRRDDEEIDKIVNDPATPTFDNTIARVDTEKGDDYYSLLDKVSNVFSCMMSANTNDEMDALAQKLSPVLTRHSNDVMLNKKLFERVKYVHDHPDRKLTSEEQMLLKNEYDGFVRSGALLSDDDKEKAPQADRADQHAGPAVLTEPAERHQGIHAAHHRRAAARRTA